MDRNQATGLILIALLLLLYFQFFAPRPEPPTQRETTESTESTQAEDTSEVKESPVPETAEPSTAADSVRVQELGILSAGATGDEEYYTLENEDLRIVFSNKGGTVKEVELKGYKRYDRNPLILLDEASSTMSLEINIGGKTLDLYELYYQAETTTRNDTLIIEFTLPAGEGRSISHIYKLPPRGFQLKYDLNFNGLTDQLGDNETLFVWVDKMKKLEEHMTESRLKATVNYYLTDGGFDDLSQRSTDYEEEVLNEPIRWIAFKQLFFNASIIADKTFRKGKVSFDINEEDTSTVKLATSLLSIPDEDIKSGSVGFRYYFGPNKYEILKKVTEGFSKNVYLGYVIVNWVNKWLIIPIFNLLERYIGNYGIIIIILVLIIKTILFPLSYKSYVSMAKTRVLKPELDEIKAKHGGDMQKAQQEQMKLYQQVGVNPLSGCIPVLLQMPILFAMFFFFPNSIELRQEPFLWSTDLSTYDNVLDLPFTIPLYGDHVSLFTLLMTVSTIIYTWSNNQASAIQGPMKSITYMMPVVFMFVLNSYPAGLSFYYFVTNIVSFGQQAIIRKFVDDEKIREILEENKKRSKSKKKSKFQLRLEEAMKAQNEAKGKKKK